MPKPASSEAARENDVAVPTTTALIDGLKAFPFTLVPDEAGAFLAFAFTWFLDSVLIWASSD